MKQKSNSKNTLIQPQNHTDSNANKNEGNVYIIVEFNRKFINFKGLLSVENPNGLITLIPCANVNSAQSILKSPKIINLSMILLHISVNDIDEQHPQDHAFNSRNVAETFDR